MHKGVVKPRTQLCHSTWITQKLPYWNLIGTTVAGKMKNLHKACRAEVFQASWREVSAVNKIVGLQQKPTICFWW